MIYIGAFIALQVIVLVAYWLMKKNNPQGVLMVAGILMLALSMLLGMHSLSPTETTGTPVFDLFRIIKETFSSNMLRVGLMIMTIGGYVAYMKKIKASDALVYVSMQPLAIFKKFSLYRCFHCNPYRTDAFSFVHRAQQDLVCCWLLLSFLFW